MDNLSNIPAKSSEPSPHGPNLDMARRFLSILDPKAKSFTFQTFHDKNKGVTAEVINGSFDEVCSRLAAYNKMGYGVYVTVNETNGTGRRKEDIVRVRDLWQELDLPANIALEDATTYWDILDMVSIEPSIEVESSPGHFHRHFLSDGLSFEDFDGCQRRMVKSHGSDSNARDRARVLRLPGFLHCKGEPVMSRLLGGTGKRYSRDEILAAFPPVAHAECAPIKGDLPHSSAAESLIRSYIAAIPGQKAELRHDWFTQGLMFGRLGDDWAEVPGRNDIRLELWESLSRKCKRFEDATGCAEKWNDVLYSAARPHEKPATLRSLRHMAKDAGWTWETSGLSPEHIEGAKAALAEAQRASPDEFEIELLDDDCRPKGEPAGAKADGKSPSFHMSFENQDFTSLPPPREWLYGKHYCRKFVSETVAPGGLGKSSLSLVEAVAMASGRDLLKNGHRHKPLKVAIWNGEDPEDELRRRRLAVMFHYEVTAEEINGRFTIASGREVPLCLMKMLDGAAVATPNVKEVKAFLKENKVDVFTVDPFVKSHRIPENDNTNIDAVATLWADIAEECNCSIELVHHVRKPAAGSNHETTVNDGRGGGALLAAARSARVLNVMTDADARKFKIKLEDRRLYFRVDNGKANMLRPANSADWYFLTSQLLGNGNEDYPQDDVGVVTAWSPPAEKSIFFDILARELASIDAWNCPHQATAIIAKLMPDERKLFGSGTHRGRMIADKLKDEGIDIKTNKLGEVIAGRVETEFGLLGFEKRDGKKLGGFWVELQAEAEGEI